MTLILVGYMGSGKSVVGHHLADSLNFDYLDLDNYIEAKENRSVAELFKVNGELYFRKMEAIYLKEVLLKDNMVISLGGGTPCYGNNMKEIVNSEAKSIYLRASVTTLTNRIFPERAHRPLVSHLNTIESMQEFVGKHLFERSAFYDQADSTINTDGKTVTQIAEKIVSQLF